MKVGATAQPAVDGQVELTGRGDAFEPRQIALLAPDEAAELCAQLEARDWAPLEQRVGDQLHRQVDVQELPAEHFAVLTERLRAAMLSLNDLVFRFEITGHRHSDAPHAVRYRPGHGHYGWHLDAGVRWPTRKLSLVLFVSPPETYSGGSLKISGGHEAISPPAGTAVVLPSFIAHRVTPVTSGTRVVVVAWMHGPTFR